MAVLLGVDVIAAVIFILLRFPLAFTTTPSFYCDSADYNSGSSNLAKPCRQSGVVGFQFNSDLAF